MGRPREVLQLAVGASSCHVASHLFNLQGLAATSSTASSHAGEGNAEDNDDLSGSSSLCSPEITHASRSLQQRTRGRVWAPRALLVDFDCIEDGSYDIMCSDYYGASHQDPLDFIGSESILYHGSVSIEPMSRRAMIHDSEWGGNWESHHHAADDDDENLRGARISGPSGRQQDASASANAKRLRPSENGRLAPNALSNQVDDDFPYDDRYGVIMSATDRGNARSPPRSSAAPLSSRYKASSSNQRHVDWDQEEEGEVESEQSDDEDEDERARSDLRVRQQQQQQQYQQRIQQQQYQQRIQHQQQHVHGTLDELWDRALFPSASPTTLPPPNRADHQDPRVPHDPPRIPASTGGNNTTSNNSGVDQSTRPAATSSNVSWKTFYRLAPHSPDSILTASSNNVEALHETAEDRIRTMLEDCDSCQGVVLFSSNSSASLGLEAQKLLDFHRDECPSLRRLSVSMMRSHQAVQTPADSAKLSPQEVARSHVRTGIQWSHLVENSTAVLPLVDEWSSSPDPASVTAGAMALACALEASTIPYRARDSAATRRRYGAGLGINSGDGYSDNAPFPMSLASFLAAATPSPVHTVLELDALTPVDNVASTNDRQVSASTTAEPMSAIPWHDQLLQGTSVERRILSRSEASSRPRQPVRDPGAWLQHPSPRGLVKLWSPSGGVSAANRINDRSHHQHFALLTSLRTTASSPPAASSDPRIDAADDYVTCLMEGMGIWYRPEQAVASVVTRQSLNDLVKDSAVGTYWKAMLKSKRSAAGVVPTSMDVASEPPVLSVLGNSTRSYSFLSNLAAQMRDVAAPGGGGSGSTSFTSVRHGWYLRDVAMGLLPEEDDCLEALSQCLDVRDRYRPPNRARDDEDQDGEDF